MLTPIGFVNAVLLAARLKSGGGTNAAPVCSTWVWLSRFSTKRRLWYPLGDPHVPCVKDANTMVSRVVAIMWVNCARGTFWFLEQPMNSLLEVHPRFQEFAKRHRVYRIAVSMGAFGGSSEKKTWIYSGHPWISELIDAQHKYGEYHGPAVALYASVDGKVHGNKPELKLSQAYPVGFGMAVRDLYLAHKVG
ncbi:unnamed protein product [Prorocentrum cordatum]|uniref:Subtilisin n=1 Tax=Prorocentrum cordatum TaxID=2364126 RepID=A0ABN9QC80_9DINO|nr:unnamed protein product [Polarella glacialis]